VKILQDWFAARYLCLSLTAAEKTSLRPDYSDIKHSAETCICVDSVEFKYRNEATVRCAEPIASFPVATVVGLPAISSVEWNNGPHQEVSSRASAPVVQQPRDCATSNPNVASHHSPSRWIATDFSTIRRRRRPQTWFRNFLMLNSKTRPLRARINRRLFRKTTGLRSCRASETR